MIDLQGGVDLPIKIIEKRQKIHAKLDPALAHCLAERVRVHDLRGIVQSRTGHALRSILIAPNMVSDQRHIQQQTEPLAGTQEEDVDENVHTVLGQHEGIQWIAAINWIPEEKEELHGLLAIPEPVENG